MTTSARCHSEEQCDEESVLYGLRCHCEPVRTLAWGAMGAPPVADEAT